MLAFLLMRLTAAISYFLKMVRRDFPKFTVNLWSCSRHFRAGKSPGKLLGRMLGNLKAIYLSQRDAIRVLGAVERILLLFPDAVGERRDRRISIINFAA